MKKLLPILLLLTTFAAGAQNYSDTTYLKEKFRRTDQILNILREFRIQIYIQPEWARADTAGAPAYVGGNFPAAANNRFLLRRGRFKLSWQHETVTKHGDSIKVGEFAFQFDATEKGFNLVKDFYGRIIDPWTGWFSVQGGIFLRPFGYECPAPPSTHESPEFARVTQIITPNEDELGEALIIESPRTFKPVYVRLDATMVNGEGIGNTGAGQSGVNTGTYQSAKDFIGRIIIGKTFDFGGGTRFGLNASGSYYNGRVLQTTANVYEVEKNSAGEAAFANVTAGTSDTAGKLKTYYKREYYDAHLQLNLDYGAGAVKGTTMVRGEFMGGQQPGTSGSSLVPIGASNAIPTTTIAGVTTTGEDLYIRKFMGTIVYVTQSIHHKVGTQTFHHDFTFKYDFYDPNTQVSGSSIISANKFNTTDIKYTTYGFGYTFCPVPYFKLVIWYDHVVNENTGLSGWTSDYKKDDVLTIRTQFMIDTWWFDKKSTTNGNVITRSY